MEVVPLENLPAELVEPCRQLAVSGVGAVGGVPEPALDLRCLLERGAARDPEVRVGRRPLGDVGEEPVDVPGLDDGVRLEREGEGNLTNLGVLLQIRHRLREAGALGQAVVVQVRDELAARDLEALVEGADGAIEPALTDKDDVRLRGEVGARAVVRAPVADDDLVGDAGDGGADRFDRLPEERVPVAGPEENRENRCVGGARDGRREGGTCRRKDRRRRWGERPPRRGRFGTGGGAAPRESLHETEERYGGEVAGEGRDRREVEPEDRRLAIGVPYDFHFDVPARTVRGRLPVAANERVRDLRRDLVRVDVDLPAAPVELLMERAVHHLLEAGELRVLVVGEPRCRERERLRHRHHAGTSFRSYSLASASLSFSICSRLSASMRSRFASWAANACKTSTGMYLHL